MRRFIEIKKDKFKDGGVPTITSEEQVKYYKISHIKIHITSKLRPLKLKSTHFH